MKYETCFFFLKLIAVWVEEEGTRFGTYTNSPKWSGKLPNGNFPLFMLYITHIASKILQGITNVLLKGTLPSGILFSIRPYRL